MREQPITGRKTDRLPEGYEERVRLNFINGSKGLNGRSKVEEYIPPTIDVLNEDLPPTLRQFEVDSQDFLVHKTGDIYEDAKNQEIYPGEIVDVCLEELDKLKKEYGIDFLTHEFSIRDYEKPANFPLTKPITNTQIIKTIIELRSIIEAMKRMDKMELEDLRKFNSALEIEKLQILYEKNSRFMNTLLNPANETIN